VLPFFQKQGFKKVFDITFGNSILHDASKVIALTKNEAEQYKRMGVYENKIEIVPNGIDLSKYENLPHKGIFRKKYGIRSTEKIVFYLGRIHRIKGIDLLIDAFSELLTKTEGLKLVIAGPDDGFLSTLKEQIEDLEIGDRILFTGPLYETNKLEAYVDADIYVLPSVYEAFPLTVLEACACGTPVVVTNRCGIADIIDSNVGYVVEYNTNQMQDAIINILNSDERRIKFGDNGRKMVIKHFDSKYVIKQIEKIHYNCYNGDDSVPKSSDEHKIKNH
jgi:glycosyltransferase involved in cell wall biosynthesis